jgi:ABC-type multidrug transport system fused ATPase/permease subunit
LSGGQRQRIGIARSLYNNPKILVLDEATSSLDGITENVVMDAIHNLSHRKTIIIIAHRLTTVEQCDVIHMIDSGKITASGTYEELIGSNEQFRKMANV